MWAETFGISIWTLLSILTVEKQLLVDISLKTNCKIKGATIASLYNAKNQARETDS